ncbi:hypothetical protein [Sphingomonas sp.]|uniref:hypothetical protein n=1 Tax=Sphingomonas sp. TaxID=28214 RepID=UPI0017D14E60|nr:hypothetical protein [Sphingomonas sp.]MBA3511841.1 hypothetical protein [Sphingomonas sp.]
MNNPEASDRPEAVQRQQDIHRLLATIGGPVQFVSIVPRGNGDGPVWVATFELGDPAAVAWVARNDAEGRASYYSLSIVRDGLNKKATKADIVAARGLFVDIDPPKNGAAFDKASALENLRSLPMPPSFIVDSGGGLQPIWLFDTPEPNLTLVEGVNRRLAEMTAGDHCFNIDRLLRVPGSLNTPDAKKAAAGRVPVRASFVA